MQHACEPVGLLAKKIERLQGLMVDCDLAVFERRTDRRVHAGESLGMTVGFNHAGGQNIGRREALACQRFLRSASGMVIDDQCSTPTTCSMQVFRPCVENGLVRKLFMPQLLPPRSEPPGPRGR